LKSSTFTLRADDGVELFVYAWEPDEKPRGVVQIVHGMAEHALRYADTAKVLVDAGWAVFAADNRGHGRTAASEADLGHLGDRDGWTLVVRDLKRVRDHARKLHPEGPYVLYGHSLGSLLSQSYLYTHPGTVDAAVLSGTDGDPGPIVMAGIGVATLERARLGKRGKSKLLDDLNFGKFNRAFAPARTAFDWLSRDTAQVDKYVNDPKCGFLMSAQSWRDIMKGVRENHRPENHAKIPKDLPLYLFAGARDPVGGQTKRIKDLVKQYQRAGLSHIETRFYPDGRHEMVNELNREEVWRDLVSWLSRVKPLSAA
jgi:alpha-beta hydrolase superfamily lysophospholipase